MLTENHVDLLAAVGRMFYVLAFLAGEGRPLRATEIARRLRTEYETIRIYLEELASLRVAARSARGWTATMTGRKLVLQTAGLPSLRFSKSAENPRFNHPKTRKNRDHAEIPRFPPFIIVNSEPPLIFNTQKESAITGPENAEKPRFLEEKRGNPAIQAGEPEEGPGSLGAGDRGEGERLQGLAGALREAGIKPNNRTRPLFESDFLTGAHVAGYASRLRGHYGSGYRTSILIGVLESLRPGDPAPERGGSLADIVCPTCHCSPCRCGDEPDDANWET